MGDVLGDCEGLRGRWRDGAAVTVAAGERNGVLGGGGKIDEVVGCVLDEGVAVFVEGSYHMGYLLWRA